MLLNDEKLNAFALNFLVVGASSLLAKTITAPLDRIKLILQNQNSAPHIVSGKRKKYKNFLDCCIRIPREQGILSFWRGNGTNVLRYIPNQILNFSFNDIFKMYLTRTHKHRFYDEAVISYIAGALAGGSCAATMYPLKFCQTRLSLDMGSVKKKSLEVQREFSGLTDCFRKISKQDGWIGLYRGFSLAIASAVIYRSLYFGLFDNLKNIYKTKKTGEENVKQHHQKPPLWIELGIAQSVTIFASLCIYPLDTVGRRIMLEAGLKPELKVFPGPWKGFKYIYITEGMGAFYKGALTNCLRATCGAFLLVFYDEFMHYFIKNK